MGILSRLKGKFRDDWCGKCQTEMTLLGKPLYALPTMRVGHYVQHDDADYYKKNLVPIRQKSQVPAGMYACGMHLYRCPVCGHRAVKLTVFLPVREEEKIEQLLLFENGEMDDFVFGVQS